MVVFEYLGETFSTYRTEYLRLRKPKAGTSAGYLKLDTVVEAKAKAVLRLGAGYQFEAG